MNVVQKLTPILSRVASVGEIIGLNDGLEVTIKNIGTFFAKPEDMTALFEYGAIISLWGIPYKGTPVVECKMGRSKSGKSFEIIHPRLFCVVSRENLEKVWRSEQESAGLLTPEIHRVPKLEPDLRNLNREEDYHFRLFRYLLTNPAMLWNEEIVSRMVS